MDSLDNLLESIDKAINDFEHHKTELLDEIADQTIDNIKAYTPYKSGKLYNSYTKGISGDTIRIDSSAEYSGDVEDGHIQHERYVPEIDKTVAEKFIPGKHMAEKGLIKESHDMDSVIDAWLNNLYILGD